MKHFRLVRKKNIHNSKCEHKEKGCLQQDEKIREEKVPSSPAKVGRLAAKASCRRGPALRTRRDFFEATIRQGRLAGKKARNSRCLFCTYINSCGVESARISFFICSATAPPTEENIWVTKAGSHRCLYYNKALSQHLSFSDHQP